MLPYEINSIGIVGTGVLDRPFFIRIRGWSGRPIPTHTELDCAKSNTPTNLNLSFKLNMQKRGCFFKTTSFIYSLFIAF